MLASPALAMSEWNHKHGDADAWREPRGTGYTFPVQLAHPRHNVTGTMAPLSAGPNSGPRTSASSAQSLPNTVSSSFVVSAPTSLPLSASDPAESSFNDSAAHYGMATTTPPWYSNITNASSSSAAISHRTRDDLPPFHHDAAPNRSGSSVTAEQLALHQTGQQRFDTSSSYESLGPQHGASARYPSSSSLPIGHHTYYDDNTAASLSHLGASTFHHGSSAAPFHDPHAAMYHPGGSHGFSQGHQPHHSFSDFRGFPISSPFEVKHRRRTTQTQFKALEGTFKETPKPSAAKRKALSEQLDMPLRAVQIWFQNRRAKAKAQSRKPGSMSKSTSGVGTSAESTGSPEFMDEEQKAVRSAPSMLSGQQQPGTWEPSSAFDKVAPPSTSSVLSDAATDIMDSASHSLNSYDARPISSSSAPSGSGDLDGTFRFAPRFSGPADNNDIKDIRSFYDHNPPYLHLQKPMSGQSQQQQQQQQHHHSQSWTPSRWNPLGDLTPMVIAERRVAANEGSAQAAPGESHHGEYFAPGPAGLSGPYGPSARSQQHGNDTFNFGGMPRPTSSGDDPQQARRESSAYPYASMSTVSAHHHPHPQQQPAAATATASWQSQGQPQQFQCLHDEPTNPPLPSWQR